MNINTRRPAVEASLARIYRPPVLSLIRRFAPSSIGTVPDAFNSSTTPATRMTHRWEHYHAFAHLRRGSRRHIFSPGEEGAAFRRACLLGEARPSFDQSEMLRRHNDDEETVKLRREMDLLRKASLTDTVKHRTMRVSGRFHELGRAYSHATWVGTHKLHYSE